MIGGILIHIAFVVCSFWVFFDCVKHKIGVYVPVTGVDKGYRKGFSPVIWAMGCFLVIPFLIYMFMRASLIKAATTYPVETDKSSNFMILALLVFALSLYSFKDFLF
ncbi:hypothetical protein [Raoultella planticola]|uniref:hypothetical protein n=1 Tax=Raoultella planticola TaxID=575 RepID=UPI0038504E6F